MRCKAIFDKEQKPVSFYQHDGILTVCIALNPVTVVTDTEYGDSVAQFEYDYNEITAPEMTLNIVDITEHPEAYLDYVPDNDSVDVEHELAELKAQSAMLMECLLEVSSIVYA